MPNVGHAAVIEGYTCWSPGSRRPVGARPHELSGPVGPRVSRPRLWYNRCDNIRTARGSDDPKQREEAQDRAQAPGSPAQAGGSSRRRAWPSGRRHATRRRAPRPCRASARTGAAPQPGGAPTGSSALGSSPGSSASRAPAGRAGWPGGSFDRAGRPTRRAAQPTASSPSSPSPPAGRAEGRARGLERRPSSPVGGGVARPVRFTRKANGRPGRGRPAGTGASRRATPVATNGPVF